MKTLERSAVEKEVNLRRPKTVSFYIKVVVYLCRDTTSMVTGSIELVK